MTRELERAARPADPAGIMGQLEQRRSRRAWIRRMQVGVLAFAVIAATTGGFLALRHAFGDSDRRTGGDPTPLPENGEIVFSAEAPDGYSHLYAMQADGSGHRQITDFGTDDTAPAVSPDGTSIAFVHQLEDAPPAIATIPMRGGAPTWLTDADLFVTGGPTWSPDGTRIAFAAHDGDMQRLFVMNANGSEAHPITGDDVHWAEAPAWSPDGTTIAFAASPISGDEEPSVWDIYTVGAEGDGLVNVTDSPDPSTDESSPTWSPDGTRIAFGRAEGNGQAIVVRTIEGGSESRITDGSSVDHAPDWSPDGTLIAFARAPLDRARTDIWRVRPDGREPTRLTRTGGDGPTWQPIPPGVATAVPTVSSEPSPLPTPHVTAEDEPLEIGLGFRLCDATRLDGVDFLGDGTRGIAWVGIRARENGTCPDGTGAGGVVAADVHGDGIADVVSETIEFCFFCRAYDRVDLDVDGAEELVVLSSEGSTPTFMIYAVSRTDGGLGIAPLRVAEPGHPEARIDPGAPLTFSTGGDEGYAGWVGCDGAGGELILEVRWRDHPIEGDTQEVHVTGLVLREHRFHVVSREDYSLPVGSPVPGASDEPACGVDWQL